MGACYSKSAHEESTPKHKRPQGSRKHIKGVKDERSSTESQEYENHRNSEDKGQKGKKEDTGHPQDSCPPKSNGDVNDKACLKNSEPVGDTKDTLPDVEKIDYGVRNESESTTPTDGKDGDTKHMRVSDRGCDTEVPVTSSSCEKDVVTNSDACKLSQNTGDLGTELIENVGGEVGADLHAIQNPEHERFRFDDTKCACCRLSLHGESPILSSYTKPLLSKRNSEIINLKPSLKKSGQSKSDRKLRLSWKSNTSLDWTDTLYNSLDRYRSEASDMFSDELSIHAPLAQFDSLDFLASDPARKDRRSIIDFNSDTFQFQFNFSGLDTVRGVNNSSPSQDEEPDASRENSRHLDRARADFHASKSSSLNLRGYSSTTSLELTSQNLQDVKTMQLDGREVVVIGRETYVQIMEELAMLKHALSQLTEVIREQELQVDAAGDRPSVSELTKLMRGLSQDSADDWANCSFDNTFLRNSVSHESDEVGEAEDTLHVSDTETPKKLERGASRTEDSGAPVLTDPKSSESVQNNVPYTNGGKNLVNHQLGSITNKSSASHGTAESGNVAFDSG